MNENLASVKVNGDIEIIRVLLPKNQRTGKFTLKNFGQVRLVTPTMAANKVKLGNEGYMTMADYKAKNYAPYGIKESDLSSSAKTETMSTALQQAHDEILALRQKLAEKAGTVESIEELNSEKTETQYPDPAAPEEKTITANVVKTDAPKVKGTPGRKKQLA